MDALAVKHAIWINASPERTWQAITDPTQLEQWYATGCPWEILSRRVGETVKFYNTDTDIQLATIEVVDAPRQFTLRWQPDPAYPTTTLLNTYTLDEENNGTRVTVTQAGYESLPDEVRQSWIDGDNGAYAAVVENLKAYVERQP
jgi:uncharacterized protein YndB with AHSA1/START domain